MIDASRIDTGSIDVAPPRGANGKPGWAREGKDWPNAPTSRFVRAGGIDWHVQIAGSGPVLLLLHGTGAATHSWRDMIAPLAKRYTVIAPDLPGHGFTSSPRDLSPAGMARGVAALLAALGVQAEQIVGHSAGAAVAVQMVQDGLADPRRIVSFNGALQPWEGTASKLFPGLAKLLFVNPIVPQLAAWRARAGIDGFLERSTGSKIDTAGVDFYRRLFATPGHAAGALGMMANWDLGPMYRRLPDLRVPLVLVYGDRDIAVPPSVAETVAALVPNAALVAMPGLGHLAHEERPEDAIKLIG
jgi:magnesium chelatase accessory protein